MKSMKSIYNYIPYPYLSKSIYIHLWKECKHKFKRVVIDQVPLEHSQFQEENMMRGTVLHELFYRFFDLIDYDKLWELNYRENYDSKYSEVYTYFYSIISGMVSEGHINNPKMLVPIKAFCRLEENHWYELRQEYPGKREVLKYFGANPGDREVFMVNEGFEIYGTSDRICREPEVTLILDYKTGPGPKKLREERRIGLYTSAISSNYTMEGNFYSLLYMLRMGYAFQTDAKGVYHFYRNGGICDDALKKVEYAFAFLGGKGGNQYESFPSYYIGRKKPSMTSIRAIVKNLFEIRACTNYPRQPWESKCLSCQFYETECKGVVPTYVPRDLLGSESASEKSISELDSSEDGSEPMDSYE